MLSRDAKRIASRSQIRIQKPITKGFQQRFVNRGKTSINTWTGTAEEILDQNRDKEPQQMRLANRVKHLMAIPYAKQVENRVWTEIQTRLNMGDKTRMDSGVTTRNIYRSSTPIATQMPKPVYNRMWERMTKQVTIRFTM